ncbi:hypothetical protein WICMUC_002720 [Wickerhamomyces mucosus]|uniref:Mannan endo-1,6-alpha-mannosidase n=1 Tax=Wickerhamomyces mucosus TaxID=1378264 RepID=A0A9P8PNQ9_9ASCO|nr:hypothetical protein WICMUC_002720 [Wickerhamomyces mucosus]
MKNRRKDINIMVLIFYFLISFAKAIFLDITSQKSICDASSLVLQGMMDYYDGSKYGGTVGMFSPPYYWWQAGHAFGGVLDFWHNCQNDTYESLLLDSLVAQTGRNYDYIPSNQSTTEGNDDQGFWGILVMSAAERNFTSPADQKQFPTWLTLAQAVYNTMWSRWDAEHCGGGLRWQIFSWNSGYSYKNTISSGCLFHISARLARFTSNDSYVQTSETIYDWLTDTGFVVDNDNYIRIYDGANIDHDCTTINHLEWTYNIGIILSGTAYLYNYTGENKWLERSEKIMNHVEKFFNNSIMYERACQPSKNCNNDQRSFRAIFSRTLGMTSILIPALSSRIRILLEASAQGAAMSCTGGYDGHTCGQDWSLGSWDNVYGLGEQMAALEIFQSLINNDAPLTNEVVNVIGDYSAGLGDGSSGSYDTMNHQPIEITKKDTIGAAFITAFVLLALLLGSILMIF